MTIGSSSSRWWRRVAAAAALGSLTVAVSACSGSGEGTAPSSTATAPSTTEADSGGAGDEVSPAVEPASVPEGFRALQREGVGLAVPAAWEPIDLEGEDLAATHDEVAEADPNLAGILDQAGALLGGASAMAALAPPGADGRDVVVATQLGLSLPTIPEALVEQVTAQFTSMGATDVVAERIAVPGLPPDARALRVSATLEVDGAPTALRVVLVPASTGIVVVTIRSDDDTVDAIIATMAAG